MSQKERTTEHFFNSVISGSIFSKFSCADLNNYNL